MSARGYPARQKRLSGRLLFCLDLEILRSLDLLFLGPRIKDSPFLYTSIIKIEMKTHKWPIIPMRFNAIKSFGNYSMKYQRLLLTAVVSLILCSCAHVDDSSSAVSCSSEPLSVCSYGASTPDSAKNVFSGDKRDIYCWPDECGSLRCARWIRNRDATWPGIETFQYFQNEMSTSLEEMAEIIPANARSSGDVYYVFSIPSHFNEGDLLSLKSCPYAYICQDEDVYRKMGLQAAYEMAVNDGLIHAPEEIGSLDEASIRGRNDALHFEAFSVVTVNDVNHVFSFVGSALKDHLELSFKMFDPEKGELCANSHVSFVGLITEIGCPSFVSDEGEMSCDYIFGGEIYRFNFAYEGGSLVVSSMEKDRVFNTLLSKDARKTVDANSVDKLPQYPSLATLIRTLGKPSNKCHTSGIPYYAYKLNDGQYFAVGLVSYPYGFDGNQRGYYAQFTKKGGTLPFEIIER